LPEPLRAQLAAELADAAINRYPQPTAPRLQRAIRGYLDLPTATPMLLGNGSDELIQLLCLAVAGSGRGVLAPDPSFVMYGLLARVHGLPFHGVALAGDAFALDVGAMCAAMARERPALVFVANPNNPTGNCFDRRDIEAIIAAAPGLVVIDEAYVPFAPATLVELAHRHEHVLVLQTLSKLGLAGLRIGILLGCEAWLAELDKLRLPYNIGVLPQIAGSVVLEQGDVLRAQAAAIRAERERMSRELSALPGVRVWPSATNFLLLRAPAGRARAVHQHLRERRVLVKLLDGAHPRLADCLRLTIGTPEENATALSALAGAIG
jgi:histidinol-phosphate aminotransferase